ncbi:MAG TPA: hypothetical protein DCL74_06565 [Succinivibrionaceae bacterium]|nr:hypothetical protein [Succinivibrionaceae bacterium]
MLRYAMLFAALSCASLVQAADDPLTYEGDFSQGVDAALTKGWLQAASSLTIDSLQSVTPAVAGQALASASFDANRLILRYDADKLRSQLTGSGHASWDGLKDPVLIWLADVNSDHIVGGGTDHEFAQALTAASRADHFDLMFPLMDLDDVQAVSPNAVLSHNDEAVINASKRYAPKFLIAGALQQDGDSMTFKWNVYDDGGKSLGNGEQSGDMASVATQAANAMARTLMENVSADSSEAANTTNTNKDQAAVEEPLALGPGNGFVRVMLTGVNNIADLENIRRSLITFGYEASSTTVAWQPEGVIFEVPSSASPAILDGTLAHAPGFAKTGDWIYSYSSSLGTATSGRDGQVGAPSYKSAASSGINQRNKISDKPATSVKVEQAQALPADGELVED